MSKFRMDDGTIVNTALASSSWDEDTRWDGHNFISVATGSQWNHEVLHRSSKGRYYVVYSSQWQGSTDHAEYVSESEAAAWLLANDHEIPENLAGCADSVEE